MKTLSEIELQKKKNQKYFLAAVGIALAYANIKEEDRNLDMFLLSTLEALLKQVDNNDYRIDPEQMKDILESIMSSSIESEQDVNLSKLTEMAENFLNDLK
jgi:chorismate mutase